MIYIFSLTAIVLVCTLYLLFRISRRKSGWRPIRNEAMAKYADRAIVIRLAESKGSSDMVNKMAFFKKPCNEIIIE